MSVAIFLCGIWLKLMGQLEIRKLAVFVGICLYGEKAMLLKTVRVNLHLFFQSLFKINVASKHTQVSAIFSLTFAFQSLRIYPGGYTVEVSNNFTPYDI